MRGDITHERLHESGRAAVSFLFKCVCNLLHLTEEERSAATEKVKVLCSYKGTAVPDAPLHSQQAVTYEWFVNDSGPFEHKTYVNRTVDHPSMHHHPFFFRT